MSKDLHSLINNLNKSEKRYFTQYLGRISAKSEETIYARLFDYMTRAESYDRDDLLSKCSFINPSQLNNVRARLYNYILESLRAYHSEGSGRISLHQMMINYEILVNKGLFSQAVKMLKKAEKKATLLEGTFLLEEILELQEYIITRRLKSKKNKEEIISLQTKIQTRRATQIRQNELKWNRILGYNLFRKEGRLTRNISSIKQLEEGILKFKERFTLDENSYMEVYHSHLESSLLYRIQGKFQSSFNELEKLESFYNENLSYVESHPEDYLRYMINRVIALNMLKQFDTSLETINKIRIIGNSAQTEEQRLMIFENTTFHEIEIYLYRRQFNKAVELVENNLLTIQNSMEKIHTVNQQSKLYRIALAYFGIGEYKTSLRWVNQILNYDQMKYRKDILSSVQILNLLIHTELKNYTLVESLLRSSEIYLKKIDRWMTPEKLVISALKKYILYRKNKSKIFSKLSIDLANNQKENPLDEHFIAYFDLQKWVGNKR
ncbi:MAG: hypothetical protein HRT58_19595 [Crocinitomicaceae bacterium]|nr:hypothetical protein [Flavobacteriales bacterium]NQZ37874.1 hypothetical protein [Crocinitomicaceae bacterium]